jgi:hypothetical protein
LTGGLDNSGTLNGDAGFGNLTITGTLHNTKTVQVGSSSLNARRGNGHRRDQRQRNRDHRGDQSRQQQFGSCVTIDSNYSQSGSTLSALTITSGTTLTVSSTVANRVVG